MDGGVCRGGGEALEVVRRNHLLESSGLHRARSFDGADRRLADVGLSSGRRESKLNNRTMHNGRRISSIVGLRTPVFTPKLESVERQWSTDDLTALDVPGQASRSMSVPLGSSATPSKLAPDQVTAFMVSESHPSHVSFCVRALGISVFCSSFFHSK